MTIPPNPNQPYGQQTPSGAHPQQGYYQQGPTPEKKHTLRNVLLILIGLGILFIGGCAVLLGAFVNEVDKAIDEEAANDKPKTVKPGRAFEHDGYKIDAGWKVAEDFGTFTINGLRVTAAEADPDLPDSGRTALLTFRLYNGTENLAEIDCNGKELQLGESSRMDCFSGDAYNTDYKTIKVSDLW